MKRLLAAVLFFLSAPASGQEQYPSVYPDAIPVTGASVIHRDDDNPITFGGTSANPDCWFVWSTTGTDHFELKCTDVDGGGTDGQIFYINTGTDDMTWLGNVSFPSTVAVGYGITITRSASNAYFELESAANEEYFSFRVQDDDGIHFVTGDAADSNESNRNLIITDYVNRIADHNHDTLEDNPTVWLHSATAVGTDDREALRMTHTTTKGLIAEAKRNEDSDTNDLWIKGGDAFETAVTNEIGGDLVIAGGLPHIDITCIQATASGTLLYFYRNDDATVTITEGVEWNCLVDDNTCATALGSYIDSNITGVTTDVTANVVSLIYDDTIYLFGMYSANGGGGGTAFVLDRNNGGAVILAGGNHNWSNSLGGAAVNIGGTAADQILLESVGNGSAVLKVNTGDNSGFATLQAGNLFANQSGGYVRTYSNGTFEENSIWKIGSGGATGKMTWNNWAGSSNVCFDFVTDGHLKLYDGDCSSAADLTISDDLFVNSVVATGGSSITTTGFLLELLRAANKEYLHFQSYADDGIHIMPGDGSDADESNRNIIIGDYAYRASDFDHSTLSANPTVFLHSVTDPDSDNTQYMSLQHDQTHSAIGSGKGGLNLTGLALPLTIIGHEKPLTDEVAIDFVRIGVAQGSHNHGTIWYSVAVVENGDTDLQSLQGMLTFSSVNEGGTVYCDVQKAFGVESYAESDAGSTLTISFACVEDAADTIDISATVNTSFAATTTLELEWSIQTAQDYTVSAL